jgi:hypothetical protein
MDLKGLSGIALLHSEGDGTLVVAGAGILCLVHQEYSAAGILGVVC